MITCSKRLVEVGVSTSVRLSSFCASLLFPFLLPFLLAYYFFVINISTSYLCFFPGSSSRVVDRRCPHQQEQRLRQGGRQRRARKTPSQSPWRRTTSSPVESNACQEAIEEDLSSFKKQKPCIILELKQNGLTYKKNPFKRIPLFQVNLFLFLESESQKLLPLTQPCMRINFSYVLSLPLKILLCIR